VLIRPEPEKGKPVKNYTVNPEDYPPEALGALLGLTVVSDPGPYVQFLKDGKPVGYVVRPGVVSLKEEITVPEELQKKMDLL